MDRVSYETFPSVEVPSLTITICWDTGDICRKLPRPGHAPYAHKSSEKNVWHAVQTGVCLSSDAIPYYMRLVSVSHCNTQLPLMEKSLCSVPPLTDLFSFSYITATSHNLIRRRSKWRAVRYRPSRRFDLCLPYSPRTLLDVCSRAGDPIPHIPHVFESSIVGRTSEHGVHLPPSLVNGARGTIFSLFSSAAHVFVGSHIADS